MRGCENIFRNSISPWTIRVLPWLPPAGASEPGPPPAGLALPRLGPLHGLPASLVLLVCCALLAACNPLPVYNPVNSENMVGRSVLVLEPSYIPPVSKELHTRIMIFMQNTHR